jgi:ribosomal-protein-alanine N-acetyltransferase
MPRNEDRLIGFCGFREFHDPPELELLFGLDESHWGRSLAGEMARTMIALGFTKWGFERIQGSTDAPNQASVRVMEKIGMKQCRREITNGLDTVYFEITPDTFDATGVVINFDGKALDFSA